MSVPTPELDKRHDVAFEPRPPSEVLSQFVDWLESEGLHLARFGATEMREKHCPRCRGFGVRMSPRAFQIYDGIAGGHGSWDERIERQRSWISGRPDCPKCEGSGYIEVAHKLDGIFLHHESHERLFARFFGIDLDRIEDERRAILAELRSAF